MSTVFKVRIGFVTKFPPNVQLRSGDYLFYAAKEYGQNYCMALRPLTHERRMNHEHVVIAERLSICDSEFVDFVDVVE